jgi:hypothetical protein
MVGVLVCTQALPVPVDKILRHGEERCRFIEPDGSVGLCGVMNTGAGSGQQTDELLKDLGQVDIRVCLGSGLLRLHT